MINKYIMRYTEEWKLKSLRKQDYNGLEGIIIGTNWEVKVTDEDGYSSTFQGATPFKPEDLNGDGFIDYKDLTEDLVLGWVKNVVSGSNMMTNYWSHIMSRIEKDIQNKKNVVVTVSEHELPWYTGSLSGSIVPDPLAGEALYPASAH